MQAETKPEVLTVEEVSRLLRVSRQTVYTMARNNEIEHFRIGNTVRFRRESIDNLMNPKVAKPVTTSTTHQE